MASAEGGSVPSGVRYGEGCPLSSWLRGLGSVVSSPSGARADDFGVFWRPQNDHFCTYMTKSGGTICISVPPAQNSGGDLSPLSPVIYAHANTHIFIHRKTVAHNISKRIITPHSRKKAAINSNRGLWDYTVMVRVMKSENDYSLMGWACKQ